MVVHGVGKSLYAQLRFGGLCKGSWRFPALALQRLPNLPHEL